ncbi:MAG: M20/M25/M40 family metallo-hydrolase [Dehalococcoidia bacterium]
MGALAQSQVDSAGPPARLAGRLLVAAGVALPFVLLVACSGGAPPAAPTSPATVSPRPAASRFDQQRALAHLEALAQDIGSRPAGSRAEREAAEYAGDRLRSFGYSVQEQPFQFEAFIDLGTTLAVTSPEERSLEPLPLRPTIAGEAEAEVVEAGRGRPEDFPADSDGKIALIRRGELFFSDKVDNAAAAGAAAVIVYNDRPGQFAAALTRPVTIPAVSISREEGRLLLDLLEGGPVTVRLEVEVESGSRTSQNVVGRPPGEDCQVYVGGHHDSVAAGPGANDNASGVATVLELARALAADGQFDAVCFVAFGAEEVGLFGSQEFVADLSDDERNAAIAMLNLDTVGVGDRWLLAGDRDLAETAADEADRLGLPHTSGELPPNLSSDHASFLDAGIAAIIIHRSADPRIHTAEDRVGFVDPNLIGEAGRLGLALIEALLRDGLP